MLSDLVSVLRHIKQIIEEYNLPQLYTDFANTLQQISQSSTDDLQITLRDIKKRISEAHKRLEPEGWSHSQLKIFDNFGARDIVGNIGSEKFQKALSENAANTPGAIQEINQLGQEISQLLTNTNNILSSLGKLGEGEIVEKGLKVVQIVFDEKVAIDDLVQLSAQSKEWRNIIRAYSLLGKTTPEQTKIIAINKASPLSIDLATLPVVANAIYLTILPLVLLWKKYLEAKEAALKLEELEMDVNEKKFELFKTVDQYAIKRISQIMEEVAQQFKEGLTESEFNEARTALSRAGPDLYSFITGGGKVDISKDDENSGLGRTFQLESDYREVRKLNINVQAKLAARAVQQESEGETESNEPIKIIKKRGRPRKSK